MYLAFALTGATPAERMARALDAFQGLWAALGGGPLSERSRVALDDPNEFGAAYEAFWEGHATRLVVRVAGGSGNQRDGYGYEVAMTLDAPGDEAPVRIALMHSGWEPAPSDFRVSVEGVSATRMGALRDALRERLGESADRTHEPLTARSNVLAAAADAPDIAIAGAREALAANPVHAYGRADLLVWLVERGAESNGRVRILREAPVLLDPWLSALENPPEGFSAAFVARVLARMRPFDRAAWGRAAPWFGHPAWVLEAAPATEALWFRVDFDGDWRVAQAVEHASQALTGWTSGVDWQECLAETLPAHPAWRATVARHARRAHDQETPIVRVTLTTVRRAPGDWELPPSRLAEKSVEEVITWTWISGPDDGDVLVIARRDARVRHATAFVSTTWCTEGSPAFRAQAAAAFESLTPLRWRAVTAAESLQPAAAEPPPWIDLPPAQRVPAMLAAAELDTSERERVRVLLASGDTHGELLALQRAFQTQALQARGAKDASGARARAEAVSAAMAVAAGDDGALGRRTHALVTELRLRDALR